MRLLLHGAGVDSLCVALLVKPDGLLWVNYGQPSVLNEWRVLIRQADYLGIPYFTERIHFPFARNDDYLINRNLSLALAGISFAVRHGFNELIFAFTRPSDFPDTTKRWLDNLNALIKLETPDITVTAPFVNTRKALVIRRALAVDPNLPLDLTVSCLKEKPCRYADDADLCPKCLETVKAIVEAGGDPYRWQTL